jgi:hypothetical protein
MAISLAGEQAGVGIAVHNSLTFWELKPAMALVFGVALSRPLLASKLLLPLRTVLS